jgi:hypothetical protein
MKQRLQGLDSRNNALQGHKTMPVAREKTLTGLNTNQKY